MSAGQRVRALLLLLLLVILAKAAQQTYRWLAYGAERAQLEEMRGRAADAGVELVWAKARADTLEGAIDRADQALQAMRRSLDRYDRYAQVGALTPDLHEAYREEVDEHNLLVRSRNEHAGEWNAMMERHNTAVDRYNRIADSIRSIAAAIGDPYFPIPLPVEAAVERGVLRPVTR